MSFFDLTDIIHHVTAIFRHYNAEGAKSKRRYATPYPSRSTVFPTTIHRDALRKSSRLLLLRPRLSRPNLWPQQRLRRLKKRRPP